MIMIIVLMQNYGFKCIAKEADLMRELLGRGAHPVHDYLINQGRTMRMCALSLMNCTHTILFLPLLLCWYVPALKTHFIISSVQLSNR
jgi:hypothetical protein